MHYLYNKTDRMLQNKIYQNFSLEIVKTFFIILFGLSIIAWTVRAVNFLDLIIESGYSIFTYFQYSFLNFFGIATKFIPLSFLLALIIFVLRQIQENEFVILWTSGVKKIQVVNLFFNLSVLILIFYLLFASIFTPYALNKSRNLLSSEQLSSFLPTVKIQQFSDSFKGFTFIVEKKFKNQVENIFLHDRSDILKNLSSKVGNNTYTTIVARKGIIENKKLLLLNGQIISSEKNNNKNEIIKFEQLNIDLSELQNTTIKEPKLQETSTNELISCFKNKIFRQVECNSDMKKEITTVLNRRIVLPFYIPVLSLICSLLLIKTKKNIFLNKFSVFIYSFLVLLYAELIIRYTGINELIRIIFIISPFILSFLLYFFLIFKFSKEIK